MILSILIPTLPDRAHFLRGLINEIYNQLQSAGLSGLGAVEILTDDRGKEFTTGRKRNDLLKRASGTYVWFIDDDDMIFRDAIHRVMQATSHNPDVIGINGIITTDGGNERGWEIRLGHPYIAVMRSDKEFYLRFPNHITPMRREHAVKVEFPDITVFEDYQWAKKLNDMKLLKTQYIIDSNIYHYRERTKK